MNRLAVFLGLLAAVVAAGCGGGQSHETTVVPGVEAFPDVLEIARAELGEDSTLLAVTVTHDEVTFVNVQFGRSTSYTYDSRAVFVRSKRSTKPVNPTRAFPISEVPLDAPATILAGIRKRDGGPVKSLTATLERDRAGKLRWRIHALVDGSEVEYAAAPDGTLAS